MNIDNKQMSIATAAKLLDDSKMLFKEVFTHGTLSVEFYKPDEVDHQKPHDRDEIYVIATGAGIFFDGEKRSNFNAGDFLFVPAGVEHRFEDFTDDFSTWVFFYGPVGGEKSNFANNS